MKFFVCWVFGPCNKTTKNGQFHVADAGSRQAFDIPSLDGIRAIAFGIVYLSHTRLNGIIPGGLGVTIFFFLSGYLITTLLRRESETTGGIDLWRFYLRRTFRILPPMYATIALTVLCVFCDLLHETISLHRLLPSLLFYTNYAKIAGVDPLPGLSALWSLAVEEHFYLLFPVAYVALLRVIPSRRHQALILLALWFVVLAWRCALVLWFKVSLEPVPYRVSLATDTRIDSILIGCILAIELNPMLDRSVWSGRTWGLLLAVGSLATFVGSILPSIPMRETIRYSIQGIGLLPCFYCAIRFPEWGCFRPLSWGWVRFIGVLSYSLYLVHGLLGHLLADWIRPVLAVEVCGFVASMALAWLFREAIEKPSMKLRDHLQARMIRPRAL